MKHPSEDVWIEKLKEGDERVFKQIFNEYYRPLTLFALKYVENIEDAKEVVQDFFVRLWLRHSDIQISFSLKIYLYQSVRNACLNYLRDNKKRTQLQQNSITTDVISTDNALENLLVAEQEEMLMKAIDKLPEKCKEIFILSRMERMNNKAIAEQLNISIKTVEAQITIALRRLLEYLIMVPLLLFSV